VRSRLTASESLFANELSVPLYQALRWFVN
jgi:hypothetical protein